jgi:ketosteroid isomerase-like protein
MIKKLLITFLTFVFFTAVFSQNDDKANVLAVERNAANAFTKHDVVVLSSIFSDDVNIISATGAVENKQQLLQAVQNVNSVTVSDMQVRIEGYIAIVTGVALETGKDNNGVYSNKLRFTDILEKTKGVWKIIHSQATAVQQ